MGADLLWPIATVLGVVGVAWLVGRAIERLGRSRERADRAEESERAKDEMRKAEARHRGGLGARVRRLLDPER